MVFAAPTSNDDESPELVVRPVLLDAPSPSGDALQRSIHVRIEQPHSAGPLVGLRGGVRGIHNCADDLLAFDAFGLLVRLRLETSSSSRTHPDFSRSFSRSEINELRLSVISRCLGSSTCVSTDTTLCASPRNSALDSTSWNHPGVAREGPSRQYWFGRNRTRAIVDPTLRSFVLLEKHAVAGIEWSTLIPLLDSTTRRSVNFLVARSEADGRVLDKISIPRGLPPVAERDGAVNGVQNHTMYEATLVDDKTTRVTCIARVDGERLLLGYSESRPRLVRRLS
jgi:hypothetical protein